MATVPVARAELLALLPGDVVPLAGPAGQAARGWLSPQLLEQHADEVDVLHLHLGPGQLCAMGSAAETGAWTDAWTAALRRCDVPLVVTVHDLRDPDDASRDRYDRLLAGVLDTAEVVLALTGGAAGEIAERFGRTAIAIGQPSRVHRLPDVDRQARLVGIHLAALPANVTEPVGLVRAALSGAVSGGGRLRVDVAPGVLLPELTGLAAAGELELHVGPPLDGPGLVGYLQQLQVSVLPTCFGTDAAWLEVCRDLGTRVVAPSSGWYGELWSGVVEYGNEEDGGLDAMSLTTAVVAALTRPAPEPADRRWREEQRRAVQRVLGEIYDRVARDRGGSAAAGTGRAQRPGAG